MTSLQERLNAGPVVPNRIVMVPFEAWAEALARTPVPSGRAQARVVRDLQAAATRIAGTSNTDELPDVGVQADQLALVLSLAPAAE